MKTMTVRDVRQKWPEAERSLVVEGEIVITRDGKPVARLLPVEEQMPRKHFDADEHRRWMKEMWGDETFDTLTPLMDDREERNLVSESARVTLATLHREDDHAPSGSKDVSNP